MKTVSINKIDEMMKAIPGSVDIEINGLAINVKKLATLAEVIEIAEGVISICFNEEGEYMPYAKDFGIRQGVISTYTNVRLPENVDHRYSICYESGIYEAVIEQINRAQFDELLGAIYKKEQSIVRFNEASARKQIEALTATIDGVATQLSEAFAGITADDMKNIVGAIGENGIDEKKLMEAYFDVKGNASDETVAE